jgi:hypothetical protein
MVHLHMLVQLKAMQGGTEDERTETVTKFRIRLDIQLPRPHREEPLQLQF